MPKNPDIKITRPPILFPQTQRIISKIERELGGTFIAYWSSGNGSVCHNDVAAFFEVLKDLGRIPEALAGYEAAIRANPGFAEAHGSRGNLLAEQENTKMLQLLERIAKKVGVEVEDPEIRALEEAAHPEQLARKIEEAYEGRDEGAGPGRAL